MSYSETIQELENLERYHWRNIQETKKLIRKTSSRRLLKVHFNKLSIEQSEHLRIVNKIISVHTEHLNSVVEGNYDISKES